MFLLTFPYTYNLQHKGIPPLIICFVVFYFRCAMP